MVNGEKMKKLAKKHLTLHEKSIEIVEAYLAFTKKIQDRYGVIILYDITEIRNKYLSELTKNK